jgi:putative MATE family efflux protein
MSAPRESRLEEFIARPRRAVWVLALPMMVGMLFHTLYSVVDTAFVGRLGPDALAAITFVGPFFFVAIALSSGLFTGVTAAVAQAVGREDSRGADLTASNGMTLSLVMGLLFALGGTFMGPAMLEAAGAEGETVGQAWAYFRIIAMGIPLFFFSSVLRAMLNGEGDAKTPMVVMGIATTINLILDPVLIFGMDMGIQGAAWATIVAQVLATVVFAWWVLVRRRTYTRLRVPDMRPQLGVMLRILRVGVPTTFAQLVMAGAMILGNKLLAHFGQLTVAGFGAGTKVDMIVSMPIMGLASGSIAVIGMFAGARRADLVRSTALYTYRWALIIGSGLGVTAFMASGPLMLLFTQDMAAIEVGRTYLGYMVFAYPLMALGMTSGRILQGLGYGMPALVITAVRTVVVGIPVAYALVYLFDAPLEAVWLSFVLGGAASVILGLAWVYLLVWRRDPTALAAEAAGS